MVEKENFSELYIETLRRLNLGPSARIAIGGLNQEILLLQQENERLKEFAVIDYLTGLGNRRALEQRKIYFESQMRSGHLRTGDKPIDSVLVASADIIGLKQYNEEHSQKAGDILIRVVANSIQRVLRKNEAFRRGGDEIVGLIPMESKLGIQRVIDKLQFDLPEVYAGLCNERPEPPLPPDFPVRMATRIYRVGGEFSSLDEAEMAADPKTAGKNNRISFNS